MADLQVGRIEPFELEDIPAVSSLDDNQLSDQAAKSEPVTVTAMDVPGEGPPFSVFTSRQKMMTVYIASFVAMVSPLSATLYYPALTTLAADYHVSQSLMQLTITVYQVSRKPMSNHRSRLANDASSRSFRALPPRSLPTTRTATVASLLMQSASLSS